MQILLSIFALLVSVDASARLLIGKDLISKYPIAQKENVFEYQIVNIGDVAAVNVEMSDQKSFPTDRFEVLKGSPTAKFEMILPNTTVYHHIIVVPRADQAIDDMDVIVDYSDSVTMKTSRVVTMWYSKKFPHFLHPSVMKKFTGSNAEAFIPFAGLVLPTTLFSLLKFLASKNRYDIKKFK